MEILQAKDIKSETHFYTKSARNCKNEGNYKTCLFRGKTVAMY